MKTRAFAAALAAVLAAAPAGCGKTSPSAEPPGPVLDGEAITFDAGAPQLASFALEAAIREAAPPVSVTGRLAWDEDATVRVFPPVAGRIVARKGAVGSRLAVGDVLAELSSPDFGQAQADAARAAADLRPRPATATGSRGSTSAAAPRKDLEAAEADLDRARAEAERTRPGSSAGAATSPRSGTPRAGRPALPPAARRSPASSSSAT